MQDIQEIFGGVIHSYTRQDALNDGMLIDVSTTAKEAGFKVPVAVTCGVWAQYVAVPEGCEGEQDETGRLWDILFMTHWTIKQGNLGGDIVYVDFFAVTERKKQEKAKVKAMIHGGDNGEPVITIMLPDEE